MKEVSHEAAYKRSYPDGHLYSIQRDPKKGILSPMYFVLPFKGKVRKDSHGLPRLIHGRGHTPQEAWKTAYEQKCNPDRFYPARTSMPRASGICTYDVNEYRLTNW